MLDVEVWESEKPLLRDAKKYIGKDHILEKLFPFIHQKNLLFDFLGQEYIPVPKNEWVFKPTISNEGVGFGTSFLKNKTDYLLQPRVKGQYLNVDVCLKDSDILSWIWIAKQNDLKFETFDYVGTDFLLLSKIQQKKILKLLNQLPESHPLNVEFIDDIIIEAHARLSIELCLMPPSVGDPDPIVEVCDASTKKYKIYNHCYGYPVFKHEKQKKHSQGEIIFSQEIFLDNDASGRVRFNTIGI